MDRKYKTPTCFRCKMRKIRCDGLATCSSCATTSAECLYDIGAKEGVIGTELRKGAACLACRRKKKKCDGKLPCRTCAASRKKLQCEYPDGMVVDLETTSGLPTPPHSSDGHSPDGYVGTTLTRKDSPDSGSSSDSSPAFVTIPVETFNPPQLKNLADEIQSPSPFTVLELPSSQPTSYMDIPELIQARDTFLDSFENKSGPPGEKTPVDLTGTPEPIAPTPFFQVPDPSSASKKDELFQIRQLFLSHRIQLGLSLPTWRLQAISDGEPRDAIHPVILHACHLTGYMLAHHLQSNIWLYLPGQSAGEAEQTRLVLASLAAVGQMPCPTAYLQTCTLLSLYFINKGDRPRAREILAKASSMALKQNVAEAVLQPPAAEELAHTGFKLTPPNLEAEVQATLAQVIYLDLSYHLILQVPKIVDPELYDAFAKLTGAPNTRMEINFVRAKSLYLLSEAKHLAAVWARGPMEEPAVSQWQCDYWNLMEALDAQRSFLTVTLIKLAFCPDLRPLLLTLKVCAIITLTGLAELLALFAKDQMELGRKKCDAIVEIISISSGFSEEDCDFLDPILSVCWRTAVATVEGCISHHESNASKDNIHDLPALAGAIRQQNRILQRALPNVPDL